MGEDQVECGRCDETFESQEALMVHSVDAHAEGLEESAESDETSTDGVAADTTAESTDGDASDAETETDSTVVDDATVDELVDALDDRTEASDGLSVEYGEGFVIAATLLALVIVVVLTVLFVLGVLDLAVYMFSLGTLFGLTLSYFQGFVQSVRQ